MMQYSNGKSVSDLPMNILATPFSIQEKKFLRDKTLIVGKGAKKVKKEKKEKERERWADRQKERMKERQQKT